MLPTSSRGNTGQKDSALGAAYGATATYHVYRSVNDAIPGFAFHSFFNSIEPLQHLAHISNDVLEGRLRVTVEESATGRSIWFSVSNCSLATLPEVFHREPGAHVNRA